MIKTYFDKALTFGARALSEDGGQPSSRRVAWVAAVFAAIFFCAGLFIGRHVAEGIDLIKFVIMSAGAMFGVTQLATTIKGPPAPPAAPAA